MSTLGRPSLLLQWATRFLTDQQMHLKMGNFESEWRQANAGVPQGTLLRPICFQFHINDLRTTSDMAKYMDEN